MFPGKGNHPEVNPWGVNYKKGAKSQDTYRGFERDILCISSTVRIQGSGSFSRAYFPLFKKAIEKSKCLTDYFSVSVNLAVAIRSSVNKLFQRDQSVCDHNYILLFNNHRHSCFPRLRKTDFWINLIWMGVCALVCCLYSIAPNIIQRETNNEFFKRKRTTTRSNNMNGGKTWENFKAKGGGGLEGGIS